MPIALKPIIERPAVNDTVLLENPVLNRILLNRGILSMDEMSYGLEKLIDPFLMENMLKSVELLEKHLRAQSNVMVIGDFDCDGATSSSIAVEGLKLMGFKRVAFMIPDRTIHGYGLTPGIVNLAGEQEPDLIVTVDSGIANIDGGLAVKALKHPCELLITDHHLASEKGLPDAASIVNPNQPTCTFPSKNLAGCGVMFYVIIALRSHLRRQGYFEEIGYREKHGVAEPNISVLIDLVALGTVADVVPLDFNNRCLVDAGLKRIRAGKGRPGIMALLEVAKKDYTKITAQDFGFALGPRINAAGRLEDMTLGVNCLLAENFEEGMILATRLDEINLQRRDIEADHVFDANTIIEKNGLNSVKGVVIHDPTWHAGVVGIVASRIKDKMNRPVICMTDTADAREARENFQRLTLIGAPAEEIRAAELRLLECDVKGSARSVEPIHLKHLLDNIYKRHPDLLSKFGGHAMAAGLSLKYKNLLRFMSEFNGLVSAEITEDILRGSISVDIMNIEAQYLTMELAKSIRMMGPWGQCFLEPVFHGRFKLESHKVLKEKHLKMVVSLVDNPGVKFDAIAFGCVVDGQKPINKTFDASFALDINEFRGKETLQLMIRNIQDPEYIAEFNHAEELTNKQKAEQAAAGVLPEDAPNQAVEVKAIAPAPAPVLTQPEVLKISKDDPAPREARIDGLPSMKPGNRATSLREEMQAMVAHVRQQSMNPRNLNSDDGRTPS
jgi:single-stranded-DNA-specific exonuclease